MTPSLDLVGGLTAAFSVDSPLDRVPGGFISLSHDLRIVAANEGMAELAGRDGKELIGKPLDSLLSGPARILFQTHVYPALKADGRVEEVFLTLTSASGETVPVLLNAVRATAEPPVSYEALIVRIRARARWEGELLAATRALERERTASQQLAAELAATAQDLATRYAEEQHMREFRDAFVGILGHELLTPVTTIYGMSHLLRERLGALDEATLRERLEDIELESDRLRRLTQDLLILSRAEGGRLDIAAEPIALDRLVARVVEAEAARAPGHRFEVELPRQLPLVLGEELYVEQVLRNYLSNAVKYSPAGTSVRVSAASEGAGVAVRVVDAGPGLGVDKPEQLFEPFYRAPGAAGQATGAGIGLYVCRELVQAMGGRVWAAPAGGGASGADFGFWLPAAEDDEAEA
ncbi:MAG: ATP-binding protein [Chloroflexota bacterium]|nr:ATP-binding protein [Chloroflexota bacterium]